MAKNQKRQKVTSQREGDRSSNRFGRRTHVFSAAVILILIAIVAWTIIRQQRPLGLGDRPSLSLSPAESQSKEGYTDVDLSAAVNQLFSSVNPSLPDNLYFPQFAKERILWI